MTGFSQDAEIFTILSTQVARLAANKRPGDQLRVWVAGCETGEAAYWAAILIRQYTRQLDKPIQVQIFATDSDAQAIRVARSGLYQRRAVADMASSWLRRYFVREGDHYRIARNIRDSIVFAVHDLLRDPPFTHLDMIVYQHQLGRLEPPARERVLERFHFALCPGGLLLLGDTPFQSRLWTQFAVVDARLHLYTRRPQTPAEPAHPDEATPPGDPATSALMYPSWLLAPGILPNVIVDATYRLVYLSRDVGRFLRITSGEPSYNLLALVRPELRDELQGVLVRVIARQRPGESYPVHMTLDGTPSIVTIAAQPLPSTRNDLLVVFFDATDLASRPGQSDWHDPSAQESAATELITLRAHLSVTIAQYEVANEELRVANEELRAINEELRAATEELEANKEEQQTLNEELLNINQELRIKIDEISLINADLQNLIVSTDIGTIFLDRELRVKRATPRAQELFGLIATGAVEGPAQRPRWQLEQRVQDDARQVLNELTLIEREMRHSDGRWFLVRLVPYRTLEDRIDGVVITFVDLTERRRAAEALQASEERLRLALDAAQMGMWDWNIADDQVIWNRQHYRLLGLTPEAQARRLADFTARVHPEDQNFVRQVVLGAVACCTSFQVEFRVIWPDGSIHWLAGTGQVAEQQGGQAIRMIGVIAEITVRKEAEALLRQAHAELERRVQERTAELEQAHLARKILLRQLVTAQEAERLRIARELHDQLGQQITGALLGIQSVKESSYGRVETLAKLDSIQELLHTMSRDMHQLALDLRPTILDDLGLAVALTSYAESWSRHSGVGTAVFVTDFDQEQLTPEIETTIYRVALEALTNVVKHAEATQISLILEHHDGLLILIVEDNGRGFDPEAVLGEPERYRRLGLLGMQERVTLVGGTLTIESVSGGGTTVIARIPLPVVEESNHNGEAAHFSR